MLPVFKVHKRLDSSGGSRYALNHCSRPYILEPKTLLGGSRLVITGVINRGTTAITQIRGLIIAPLINYP